jgi:PIN domain nuclease of toxin-antitoxin system
MRLLLDTHTALWWQAEDGRLTQEARRAIATADIVWISSVAGWEAAIKINRGRLRLHEPLHVTLASDDLTELPLTLAHAEEFQRTPRHHNDPFDRMLVAQAGAEGLTLVSRDESIALYDVDILKV